MFSVGADPYNSQPNQLYGGWNLDQARGNTWATKEYYRMIARLSADEEERAKARKWLKMYKVAIHANPALKAQVRAQGKPYWNKAIFPKMTDVQKSALLTAFLGTPLSEDQGPQVLSRLYRKAPFPGASITAHNRILGVPYYAPTQRLPSSINYGTWRTTKELEDAFKAMAGTKSYTAKEVADTFGVSERAAQQAMDSMRRVKQEILAPVVAQDNSGMPDTQ